MKSRLIFLGVCLSVLAGPALARDPGLYIHGAVGAGAYLFGGLQGSSFYRFQDGRMGISGQRGPAHATGPSRGLGVDLVFLKLREKECFSQDCGSSRGWKNEAPLWIPSAFATWDWEDGGLLLGSGVVLGLTLSGVPMVFPRAALRLGSRRKLYVSFGLGEEGGRFAPGLMSAGVGGRLLQTDFWAGANLIPFGPGPALCVSRGFGTTRISLGGRWAKRTAIHYDRGDSEESFTFTGPEFGMFTQLEWKVK